ncbi:hypothetical protein RCC89_20135 [Cytophagaceae bacterium ABcell3]|nr:hypothetical protein RCC89_20135 [Cytophagaceae bacterium ABcell3]
MKMKGILAVTVLCALLYGCGAPPQTAGPIPAIETGDRVHTQEIDQERVYSSVSPRTEQNLPPGQQGPTGTNQEEARFGPTNTYDTRNWEDTYGSEFDPHQRVHIYEGGGTSKYGQSGSTNPIQQQRRYRDAEVEEEAIEEYEEEQEEREQIEAGEVRGGN